VNGGTCTSVGVGGCTLGGCFGPFSQALGPSASNVLQAVVVLANGTIVTASKCSHPELFWALRGGGSGWGVVTAWVMRTYRSPRYLTRASYSGEVKSGRPDDILAVGVEVLRAADVVMGAKQGWNGDILLPTFKSARFSIGLSTYEGNASIAEPLFQALDSWIRSQPKAMQASGKFASSVQRKPTGPRGWARPGAPEGQVYLPWDDTHHDTEIGTEHLVSMSKYMTRASINEGPADAGKVKMANAILNITRLSCSGPLAGALCRPSLGMGLHKGQGNAKPAAAALFRETSQNPVLLSAVGVLFSQWRVPALPQLPPSAAVLRALWPRLPKYTGIQKHEALYQVCSAGARGDEALARDCFTQWATRRQAIVAQLLLVKDAMNYHFPTANGYSGSYWNEADFDEPNWQTSFWGEKNYEKLLHVKRSYDPRGVFVCHHCVGSEEWDSTGNCRA
jgi:hypothetical protein